MPQMEYNQTEVDFAIAQAVAAAEQQAADANSQLAASLQAQIDALKPVTPPVTPPVTSSALKIGASVLDKFPGVTLGAHRVYYGLEGSGNTPATALTAARAAELAKQRLVISIDRGKGTAGWVAPDPAKLAGFAPALKAVSDLRVILHHEPENDFLQASDGAVLTRAQNLAGFQGWYKAAAAWMRVNLPGIPIGPCLMAWVANKGGLGWAAWLDALPDDLIDFIGVDGYANPGQSAPNQLLQVAYAYAVKRGKPLVIAETGQESTADQVAWMNGLIAWSQAQTKANPKSPIDTITWWPNKGPNGDYTPTSALIGALPRMLSTV